MHDVLSVVSNIARLNRVPVDQDKGNSPHEIHTDSHSNHFEGIASLAIYK